MGVKDSTIGIPSIEMGWWSDRWSFPSSLNSVSVLGFVAWGRSARERLPPVFANSQSRRYAVSPRGFRSRWKVGLNPFHTLSFESARVLPWRFPLRRRSPAKSIWLPSAKRNARSSPLQPTWWHWQGQPQARLSIALSLVQELSRRISSPEDVRRPEAAVPCSLQAKRPAASSRREPTRTYRYRLRLQQTSLFHTGHETLHAATSGLFRCSAAMPVCFKAYRMRVTITL